MSIHKRQTTMTFVPKECVSCLCLLLLLLVPHISSAQPDKDITASILQEYPEGDEAEENALELLLREALPDSLSTSEWSDDVISKPSEAKWRELLASLSSRTSKHDVKRLFPPRYMASRGKRQPSHLAFLGSRGKRQPAPGMFFGSRGRRQWEIYENVKRLSANTFLGSRGKRYYSLDDDNDVSDAMPIFGRQLRGLRERPPPYGFSPSRG